MRILALEHAPDTNAELERIGVDPAAWGIFALKSRTLAVRLDGLSVAAANILKQTALAVGADCAINARAITGRVRRSDALLLVTPRQLAAVCDRLRHQPAFIARLASELTGLLARYQQSATAIRVGSRRLDLNRRTLVMGILNVTPDSFSDGGRFHDPAAAADHAWKLEQEGADIIDIGAESTRPGAQAVTAREQRRRLGPVLKLLAGRLRTPLSVDTMDAEVAEFALDHGAGIVNDVSAFGSDRRMAGLVARRDVPCVLMHMKGRPRTMQRRPIYRDLMAEITAALNRALERARAAGVRPEQVIIDPGLGFGKTVEHNFEILRRLAELKSLGRPILVGPSRKSFIGRTLELGTEERLEGTLAACVLAARNGASIVRVHDVRAARRALAVADRITGKD